MGASGEILPRVLTFVTIYFAVLQVMNSVSPVGRGQQAVVAGPPSAAGEGSRQFQSAPVESSVWKWLFEAPLANMPQEERLRLLREENAWKNDLILWKVMPEWFKEATPQFVHSYCRCLLLTYAVYMLVGLAWAYYTYFCFGDQLYKPGTIPSRKDILEQIRVSFGAIPLYSALPAFTEWLAESGFTQAYPRIDNVGVAWFLAYFAMYMLSVEFGVYWMHRLLHDIPWAYKLLHYDHHKYNKEHTLSPFAGLAFHPIDGILQAWPYTMTMLFCPMHFFSHEILLFATGVWTTNIHDCLHGKVWPVMGGGYHLIHHTTYKHNYGHYFTYMDWMFGSLLTPEDHEVMMSERSIKAQAAAAKAAAPASDATAAVSTQAASKAATGAPTGGKRAPSQPAASALSKRAAVVASS